MEIRGEHHYQADVDTVFRIFGDPEQVTAKAESLGARNIEINRCDLSETNLEVDISREVPADVPGMLKKFLDAWNSVHQTESWQGTPGEGYCCDLKIDIKGVPVTFTGTMDLHATDDGCVNNVVLKIECGIPLVGKKLAEFVAANSRENMDAEYRFIKASLGE